MPRQRKQTLLRLDPAVHDALTRWAHDELRSANAQIEFLLRRALAEAGRLPGDVGAIPRRGRPPKAAIDEPAAKAAGLPDETGGHSAGACEGPAGEEAPAAGEGQAAGTDRRPAASERQGATKGAAEDATGATSPGAAGTSPGAASAP